MKTLVLILSLLIFNSFSWSQNDFHYDHFVDSLKMNQVQVEIYNDSSAREIRYLGVLKMKESDFHTQNRTYHVLAEYFELQMAISRKGITRLIFLNEKKEIVKSYRFSHKSELPEKITNNGLQYGDITLRYLSLPPLFCIPEKSCFGSE